MAQIKCSNCGSYKIYVQDQNMGCARLYTLLLGALLGLGGCAVMYTSMNLLEGDPDAFLMFATGFIIFSIGFGPIIFISRKRKNYLVECGSCGKKWDTHLE